MPRLPRIHLQGAVYLVRVRAASPDPLFRDSEDYQTYLRLLSEHSARRSSKLFAYCLLPDHVYLCVETPSGEALSSLMHDLSLSYTRSVNKRYHRSGALFQERFHAHLVEKSSHLLPLTAYLHQYPVQLGLAQAVETSAYSSAAAYGLAEQSGAEAPVVVDEVLALLPTDPTSDAYGRYVRSFSVSQFQDLHRTLDQKRILGSEAFAQQVKAESVRAKQPEPVALSTRPVSGPAPRRASAMTEVGVAAAALIVGGVVLALSQRVDSLTQTVLALSQENDAQLRAQYSLAIQEDHVQLVGLSGTEWDIRMVPLNASSSVALQDRLSFSQTQMLSRELSEEGFGVSRYLVSPQPNESGSWETIQTNSTGAVVSWKGEWQGSAMRGLLTKQPIGKPAETFTFVGVAHTAAATLRSEI